MGANTVLHMMPNGSNLQAHGLEASENTLNAGEGQVFLPNLYGALLLMWNGRPDYMDAV